MFGNAPGDAHDYQKFDNCIEWSTKDYFAECKVECIIINAPFLDRARIRSKRIERKKSECVVLYSISLRQTEEEMVLRRDRERARTGNTVATSLDPPEQRSLEPNRWQLVVQL